MVQTYEHGTNTSLLSDALSSSVESGPIFGVVAALTDFLMCCSGLHLVTFGLGGISLS